MYVLDVNKKTIFARLKDVFPECEVLITSSPQLYPLRCLVDACPKNASCMGKLVHRIKYIFDTFTEAELLLLYFAYPDRPGSIRCGVFWKDFREPYVRTINRASWELFKKKGDAYVWEMPQSLFLTGKADDNKLVQLGTKKS